MTKIYLIRHGESIGNKTKTFTGSTDLDLTERGYAQGKTVVEFFKSNPVSRVYASPLCRAYHTAVPTAELFGRNIETVSEFREIDGGVFEKMLFEEIARVYPEDYAVFKGDIGNLRPPMGEPVEEVYDRTNACLLRLALENAGESLAVFTHAIPIRSVITKLKGLPASRMREVEWVANASVTEVLFDEGTSEFTLGRVDIREHLGGSETSLSDIT